MKAVLCILVVALALVAAGTATAAKQGRCYVQSYLQGKWWTGNVTVSQNTSCPFAQRVTRASIAFILRNGGIGDGSFYVHVYSPVTFKWYWMNCAAHGDIYYSRVFVDCRGGINARVAFNAHNGR